MNTPSAADVVTHGSHVKHSSSAGHGPSDPHAHSHHVVSLSLLTGIFGVLMVLTFLTVAVTWQDFGYNMNLTIALAIAVLKGGLVALYFMHLRWDNPFNAVALLASLLFVGLFIVVALIDTGSYRGNVDQVSDVPTVAK